MATFKVTPAHEKFIRGYAKSRKLDANEGLEKLLGIAQSRVKALGNYAVKSAKKGRKTSKTARKAARKAAAKSTRKAAAKSPARKSRRATASKKSAGVPKGFHKTNSTPAPEATAAATA